MKKIIRTLSVALLISLMVGCAGASDYEIELINEFKVIKTSAEKIHIGSSKYSYDGLLIPILKNYEEGEYVTQVAHDEDRYIIAKTNLGEYYIMDTEEISLYDSLTKDEFDKRKENLGISDSIILKELDEYEKIR